MKNSCYCKLLVGVALNARFTTNGMCVKNNANIYVARTSNNRVIAARDLYCCLLPQWSFAHMLLRLSDHNNTIVDLPFRIVLPFPPRYCIPYMRSSLYQLVVCIKGFCVCALHCVHAITSITHCIRFCPSAWTPCFQWVEFCIASARTTLAVSAVEPS